MMQNRAPLPEVAREETRWPVAVALIGAGALHNVLGPNLNVGPTWLPLGLVTLLVVAAVVAVSLRKGELATAMGHATSAVLTAFMLGSVGLLVAAVVHRTEAPVDLLRSAAALWATNILVFASWYWRLDAGGPSEREKLPAHHKGSFYFPQMTMPAEIKEATGQTQWSPGFVDYLFLAFNTSTALSPADTPALSRWAKVLMMLQSLISFSVIILLAARAVNML